MRHALMLLILLCSTTCFAQNYGVAVQERIINLPEDGQKWYISVVGDAPDARYQEVLSWFESVDGLKTLKSKVHFCPVKTNSPIFKERYAPNIGVLPVVRVQSADGVVLYEAAGNKIPFTGEALYSAIASAVNGSEELLPWRRRHATPAPAPVTPDPVTPIDTDPAPGPIDNGGAPVIEDVTPEWPLWLVPLLFAIGIAAGVIEKARAYHKSKHTS